ncbi:MAG: sugar phosphate nucleotidyltransferase [Candidatus Nanoarchaeia archaeon]
MKGIILAAGKGMRLRPITKVVGKHLVPIYNKPLIYYPIELLKECGIKNILIILNEESLPITRDLLKEGEELGVKLSYQTQTEQKGMAHALALASDFSAGDTIAVTVCDNLFGDIPDVSNFKGGARLFFKETPDANKFTVGEFSKDGRLIALEEKPEKPKSNYGLAGFYLYDKNIFEYIKDLKPSIRGELELAEANNKYIKEGKMEHRILDGFWIDTGSFESLFKAAEYIREKELSKRIS